MFPRSKTVLNHHCTSVEILGNHSSPVGSPPCICNHYSCSLSFSFSSFSGLSRLWCHLRANSAPPVQLDVEELDASHRRLSREANTHTGQNWFSSFSILLSSPTVSGLKRLGAGFIMVFAPCFRCSPLLDACCHLSSSHADQEAQFACRCGRTLLVISEEHFSLLHALEGGSLK